jgi:hypothetical protein
MEHSGFAPERQLPDAFLNADLYVYFGSWIVSVQAHLEPRAGGTRGEAVYPRSWN